MGISFGIMVSLFYLCITNTHTMKSIKVRFNLSRGKNYMKWKVEYPDGTVFYFDPINVQLVMTDCTLKNHKKTAEKIHNGANKSVCAWVLCKTLNLNINKDIRDFWNVNTKQIRYNPKVQPNWMIDDINQQVNGCICDGKKVHTIHSIGKSLFTNDKLI